MTQAPVPEHPHDKLLWIPVLLAATAGAAFGFGLGPHPQLSALRTPLAFLVIMIIAGNLPQSSTPTRTQALRRVAGYLSGLALGFLITAAGEN